MTVMGALVIVMEGFVMVVAVAINLISLNLHIAQNLHPRTILGQRWKHFKWPRLESSTIRR